ncbi:MAG: hypothetical protein AAGK37_04220 [Pseudomonadota bacterium]
MQLISPGLSDATLKLAVAGQEFAAEIREVVFSDGRAFVAATPAKALKRAHSLGELPEILQCPDGFRAVPVMLSEPEKRDERPVRVPWSWELIKTEQGGAAL